MPLAKQNDINNNKQKRYLNHRFLNVRLIVIKIEQRLNINKRKQIGLLYNVMKYHTFQTQQQTTNNTQIGQI